MEFFKIPRFPDYRVSEHGDVFQVIKMNPDETLVLEPSHITSRDRINMCDHLGKCHQISVKPKVYDWIKHTHWFKTKYKQVPNLDSNIYFRDGFFYRESSIMKRHKVNGNTIHCHHSGKKHQVNISIVRLFLATVPYRYMKGFGRWQEYRLETSKGISKKGCITKEGRIDESLIGDFFLVHDSLPLGMTILSRTEGEKRYRKGIIKKFNLLTGEEII